MNIRIVKGAKYFYDMKPSEFSLAGTTHPVKWRQLMELMRLIIQEAEENGAP